MKFAAGLKKLCWIFSLQFLLSTVVVFSIAINVSTVDAQPMYKIFTPDIVPKGKTFIGRVVEETTEGYIPVAPGTGISISGQVVEAEENGQAEAIARRAGPAVARSRAR